MNRTWLTLGLIACGTVACSSTSTTTTTDLDASAVDSGPPITPKDSGTQKDGSGGKPPVVDAGADDLDAPCADTTTLQTCLSCLAPNHKTGVTAFLKARTTCLCQAGADYCKTQCATTECAATPKNPDATCSACMSTALDSSDDGGADGKCLAPVEAACNAETDCVAFFGAANKFCAGKK